MAASNHDTWHRGQRVLAQWEPDGYYYPGTITAHDEHSYLVIYDDGDKATVTADQLAPLDIKVGSRVFGRWQGDTLYYAGEVDQQEGAAIHIAYDDGDKEWTTVRMVRVRR